MAKILGDAVARLGGLARKNPWWSGIAVCLVVFSIGGAAGVLIGRWMLGQTCIDPDPRADCDGAVLLGMSIIILSPVISGLLGIVAGTIVKRRLDWLNTWKAPE